MSAYRWTETTRSEETLEWESLPILGAREQRYERVERVVTIFIATVGWGFVCAAIWHWVF